MLDLLSIRTDKEAVVSSPYSSSASFLMSVSRLDYYYLFSATVVPSFVESSHVYYIALSSLP
jgi:hypothetical protein